MRQLTQQEAERCAKALGWKFIEGVWERPQLDQVYNYMNPFDPYFWIGRLFDNLFCLCPDFVLFNDGFDGNGTLWTIKPDILGWSDLPDLGFANHPCLALCEAIEKLKESQRGEK